MKVIKGIFIFFTLMFLAIFLSASITESQDAVRAIVTKGNPKIMKADANDWTDCKVDTAIDNGDRIKTLKGESVELSFIKGDMNVVKVEEGSDVVIRVKQPPYSIELLNGSLLSLIKKLPSKSTFEVRTPAGLSGARGTGWRSQTDGSKATFDAFEESIYAKGIDKTGNEIEGELIIQSGWRTIIDKFEKPSRLEKLSELDMEKWNKWKEELSERLKGPDVDKLERADKLSGTIEELESRKEDDEERLDVDRIEKRLEPTSTASQGGGSY